MGTDRLKLYNDALLEVGERKLLSLAVTEPARRYLDQVWDAGWVDKVLAAGQWTFATRTVRLDAETSVDPLFGREYAFAIPPDHIRTTAFSNDEFFNRPMLEVDIAKGYWFASMTPLYCSYVSNDALYGSDLSKWPPDFCEYAARYGARRVLPKLTGNKTDKNELEKDMRKCLTRAQSADSMERAVRFPPSGTLVNARQRGRTGGGWDRGSRSSLYGS